MAGQIFIFRMVPPSKILPRDQAPTGHLYHNNHDGTFTDVTLSAGVARSGWGQGGCVGDYDNDGYLDLFLTLSGARILLFHNNGDGTFTDATDKAGLKTSKPQWSTGCSFVDYDRDGKADLFVSRYVDFSYDSVPGRARENGANGRESM